MNKDTVASPVSLAELQKINKQHSKVLKACGIGFDELSPATKDELNQMVDLQQKTGLSTCDLGHFVQWYTDRLDEMFPQTLAIGQLKRETRDFNDEATDYEQKSAVLESYMNNILHGKCSDADVRKNLEDKRKEIELFERKKQQMKSIETIDIDDIVVKIESLNKTK